MCSVNRERTDKKHRKQNVGRPYNVRSRSPMFSESSEVNRTGIRRYNHSIVSRKTESVQPLPREVNLNKHILPPTVQPKYFENKTITSMAPNKLEASPSVVLPKDKIFELLAETDISEKFGYKRMPVDWTDTHLQVTPGVNLLVMCKNYKCDFYLKNVICRRGLYPERNGYCPMDREIFMIKCPICKLPISPDASIGIGFYKCEFEVSFMLRSRESRSIELCASGDTLVYAKCSKANNEKFLYLEINVGANRRRD